MKEEMKSKMKISMEDLRVRSGEVNDRRPLVAFLYELMRDYTTPGVVEKIISQDQCATSAEEFQFSNGWLATYAKDLAERLEQRHNRDAVLNWLNAQNNIATEREKQFIIRDLIRCREEQLLFKKNEAHPLTEIMRLGKSGDPGANKPNYEF